MPAVVLNLEYNELLDMSTFDNRQLSMKCTKMHEGQPMIDLLPRVRYILRIAPSVRKAEFPVASSLLFSCGLLLLPHHGSSPDTVDRVVAMNLSEKAVRLAHGRVLFNEDTIARCPAGAMSPMPSDISSPGTPPHGGPECSGETEITMELLHLPPPHIAT